MLHIVFEYKDAYSHGKWRKQECVMSSIAECIKVYGLDEGDCSYRILSAEPVNKED